MPTEILFAGGRFETISSISGSVTQTTTGGRFDSAYADQALEVSAASTMTFLLYTAASNILSATTITSGRTFYAHFDHWSNLFGSGSPGTNLAELVDSSGFPWFAIRCANGTNFGIFFNSGTGASPTWTQIGGTAALVTLTLETLDIEITLGSPHVVSVCKNGTLWRSGSFTQASFTNIAGLRLGVSGNNGIYSQILMSENIPTIGAKVRTARATGAGNINQWSSTHTAVNEVTASDATFQAATSAGLKSTHAMTDVTIPAGFELRTVFNWVRAKQDGSAPQNIRSVLRQGGVDYTTGNLSGLGVAFSPVGSRYDLAPDGTAWDATKWNAIEVGYESAT